MTKALASKTYILTHIQNILKIVEIKIQQQFSPIKLEEIVDF